MGLFKSLSHFAASMFGLVQAPTKKATSLKPIDRKSIAYIKWFSAQERIDAVTNLACPLILLDEIACNDASEDVRIAALRNPNCPPQTLEKILNLLDIDTVTSQYVYKYWALKHLNCPSSALLHVASNEQEFSLRRMAFLHPNCPIEKLK